MVTTSPEGIEVFQELKAALARSKGAVSECQSEADRLDARMHDLLDRRGEALMRLAKHYLPEISKPAIESTFEGIRADLMAILARREARRAELRGQLDAGLEEARRRNAEIDDVTGRLNEKVALRETLEAQVAEILKGNADFQERSKLALQAEEKLHRDERRVEEMTRESAEKLPQYDRSRLFRYLFDRGYGTSDYKPSSWVRRLDRFVADLIDYPSAKNGYDFLKKTHELVAAEVSKRRDQFTELMQQVEAIEKIEADRVGLTAVLAEGDALGTDRDRLVKEVDRLQREARRLQQGLADLDQEQSEFYRQALDRFRTFLGETKVAMLEWKAKQTPEPDDDEIVAELAQVDGQIQKITPTLADLSTRREDAERIQGRLDRLIRMYRQANYDSDRCYFERLDHRGEIARLEGGTVAVDDLWRALQATQKFRPSWVQETTANGAQVAASPAGRVILGALVDIAGAAMRDSAYRGVQRRSDVSFTFPTFPQSGGGGGGRSSGPSGSEGGFTNGDGF